MKTDSIQAMLADPNIDPTTWVGKALMTWVDNNLMECMQDPVARRYLFQGMEPNDVKKLAKGVVEIYKQEQDTVMVHRFLTDLNSLTSKMSNDWALRYAINEASETLDSICDNVTVDHIVHMLMPQGDDTSAPNLIRLLRPEHVELLLEKRAPIKWSSRNWFKLIDIAPVDDLFRLAGIIWDTHLRRPDASDGYQGKVQDILWRIFVRLPESQLANWLKWLEETNISSAWGNGEELLSKTLDSRYSFSLSEKVCRCGRVSKSKSAASAHNRRCEDDDDKLNLVKAAKVLLASKTTLACNKCGRPCKSKPGLSLHQKKCTSELGDKVRLARSRAC